jgi:diaminopimelate epimerase
VERFFKYQGLGNDFVVIDRRQTGVDLDPATAIAWCDRRRGIGADGVLAILPGKGVGKMVVHNADGSIAEMCGNGLRCVVKFLAETSGDRPARMDVETGAGVLASAIDWSGADATRITVAMGPAKLEAANLPDGGPFIDQLIPGLAGIRGTAVNMGNPHLVLLDVGPARAAELGPGLEAHPLFPQRANVSFTQPRGAGGLEVAVYERGVGLTDACGTGACAAVTAHALAGRVAWNAWVPVQLPGGLLEIKVAADRSQVWLRGPAVKVYEGSL